MSNQQFSFLALPETRLSPAPGERRPHPADAGLDWEDPVGIKKKKQTYTLFFHNNSQFANPFNTF